MSLDLIRGLMPVLVKKRVKTRVWSSAQAVLVRFEALFSIGQCVDSAQPLAIGGGILNTA
jgi:hypothetical protein